MKTAKMFVNDNAFEVLLAISDEEQTRGLMYQRPPVPNMAFVYGQPKVNRFWMKQTPAPLDIVFCLNNKIVSICNGEPFSTRLVGDGVSDLVVEFPQGTCKQIGASVGDDIRLEYDKDTIMKIFMAQNQFRL